MKKLKILRRILLIFFIAILVILIIAFLFLKFYPSVGKTPDKEMQKSFAEKTDKFYDGEFHNENGFKLMSGNIGKKSSRRTPDDTIPVMELKDIQRADVNDMNVTWLGHSSSFIQMGDKNILIDPVLTKRTSPVGFAGPKRFSDIALKPENVPDIDVLFISHDHYDHLDYDTIKAIDSKVSAYIVPLGVDSYLRGWGIDESKLHSLYWWEDIELDGLTCTLTPSQHFSGRNPLKSNITLWGGLYINNGKHSLYFTGDGGYYDVFTKVREKLGAPELMLVEDGQYDTGWPDSHMTPESSAQAVKDAWAKWAIPVHWGAFVLANHSWDDPIIRITREAERLGVNLATPRIGETVSFDSIDSFTEKWWEGLD